MNIQNYLANLILAQLTGKKPENIPENLDINEIINISLRNQIDYLVMGALLRTDNLPEKHAQLLRQSVQISVLRTLTQVTELNNIIQIFERNSIKNQPMKGACMKYMYPSPEMREMGDIDILVDNTQMNKVADLLKGLGYTLTKSVKHHDIYSKPPFVVLEVHRAMYDKTVDSNQNDYFKNFDRTVVREGMKYTYDLNREDFYVYMLAHMAKHFYAMGCGIRNLVDIYIYLEKYGKELNRSYIKQELEKCGIYDFSVYVEELAYIWLGGKKSSPFYDDLFEYMMDCGIYGKDENGIWHKFVEEKKNRKKLTKFELKKWYYFPSLFYMSEDYPWLEKYPFLLPIAWCIRGFRGLFLKKGSKKREMLNSINSEKADAYKNLYGKMKLKFKR